MKGLSGLYSEFQVNLSELSSSIAGASPNPPCHREDKEAKTNQYNFPIPLQYLYHNLYILHILYPSMSCYNYSLVCLFLVSF